PFFLIPEMNLLLEQAMIQEGMPALGILSASLARPSLQVLKLAPAFLWEPVDVVKLMEFVTLPLKPVEPGLALEIARVLAAKPGLHSDQWFAAVYGYLEQAEVPEQAREQYEFWFNRRRYRADTSAPKRDAIALYGYLNGWALEQYGDSDTPNPSLLVLAEQARRIRDLLEALPEQRISFLELERIVRTIYEPSPAQYSPAEAGSFGYVHQPGAIAAPVDMLIWWNCLHTQGAPPPERWSAAERAFLEMQGLRLRTPRQESQWQLLRQQRPVLQTARRLVLVVPDYADGAEAVPNLLLGDIEAAFPEAKSLQYCLDEAADRERLAHIFALPAPAQVPVRSAARPRPHLLLSQPEALAESEYETPTSLETLFYYPHRWFFRQRLRMFRSALLAISADETLKGNLAHRFFEMLLVRDDLPALQRQAVYDWVEDEAPALLEREGATLLLYGREPERKAFLTKVKNAAWSLISLIRSNGWSVLHTELDLEGHFAQIPVRGKADLVLGRGEERAIVDLKWGGTNRR
ncbi:MAG TPA: PD-(D/E)XK nuclease family protein, partial [Saprospiraceae bacterium]|nr:PD-(D/E)XK nuclease family protein [Saprospiraceae bacterium]